MPHTESVLRAVRLIGRQAHVCVSESVESPVAFGLIRPVVLFPAGFEYLSEETQKIEALHALLQANPLNRALQKIGRAHV